MPITVRYVSGVDSSLSKDRSRNAVDTAVMAGTKQSRARSESHEQDLDVSVFLVLHFDNSLNLCRSITARTLVLQTEPVLESLVARKTLGVLSRNNFSGTLLKIKSFKERQGTSGPEQNSAKGISSA